MIAGFFDQIKPIFILKQSTLMALVLPKWFLPYRQLLVYMIGYRRLVGLLTILSTYQTQTNNGNSFCPMLNFGHNEPYPILQMIALLKFYNS